MNAIKIVDNISVVFTTLNRGIDNTGYQNIKTERMINPKKAHSFDQRATMYDEVRPGYPEELYKDIQRVTGVHEGSLVIEIGAGNGIATQQMYHHWKSAICAIEPGKHLFILAQKRLANIRSIQVINCVFEQYTPERQCDLIVSATAFHWIDPTSKFRKLTEILKSGGYIAVFWNNYSRDDSTIFDEIQQAYTAYYPGKSWGDDIPSAHLRVAQRQRIDERRRELTEAPHFTVIAHHEYLQTRTYTASEYVKLLRTFSSNAIKSEHDLQPFYQQVEAVIRRHDNRIVLPILVNLEIVRKE